MANTTQELLREAEQAFQQGSFQAAGLKCIEIQQKDPNHTTSWVLRGMSSVRMGEPVQAIEWLTRATQLKPDGCEGWLWLGIAYRDGGDPESAITALRTATRLRPGLAIALGELARAYTAAGQRSKAVITWERVILAAPTDPIFLYEKARAHVAVGDLETALNTLEQAIRVDRDPFPAVVSFANFLLDQAHRREAIAVFRRAHSFGPDLAIGRIQLAQALYEEGSRDEAAAILVAVTESEPASSGALEAATALLQQMGRFDDAVRGLDKALVEAPDKSRLYFDRFSCRRAVPADREIIQRMEELLNWDGRSIEDQRYLHYALGKAYNDLGEPGKAMAHYDKANEAMRRISTAPKFNPELHTRDIDLKISTFRQEFFDRHRALGIDSEVPIFIIGMIRSGTSLVEQIVTSHADVAGGGELMYWYERSRGSIGPGVGLDGAPIPSQEFEKLQADYLRLLKGIDADSARVTDKMPYNYLFVGNIHLAFPNAKFIHCRRHPVDNCLSIYTTPYGNPLDFAHSRSTVVFAYQEYVRLMDHWRSVIPADRLLDVQYEELVGNPEPVTRRMVEFCGLGWDEACLRPEENPRVVRTPSLWQVRQPVYKTSSERWRRYERWLGEFASLLPS